MKLGNPKAFACPDCDVQVALTACALGDDKNIYLIGKCPKCHATVTIDVTKILELFCGGVGNAN